MVLSRSLQIIFFRSPQILAKMKSSIIVWGSSHVSEYHHFHDAFRSYFHDQRRFTDLTINSKSGGQMTEDVAKQIVDDVQRRSEHCQIQVVLMSSNNLRRNSDWTPQGVIKIYEFIINQTKSVKNLYFVFCGIVPSPSTDNVSKPRFSQFNTLLKEQCKLNRFCRYFNTPKYLTSAGVVESDLFSVDGIHLNKAGAHCLCKNLAFCIKNTSKILRICLCDGFSQKFCFDCCSSTYAKAWSGMSANS